MVAKIAVITYSTYSHTDTLAQAVIDGAKSTGAVVEHFQIQELLSEATRTKMGAAKIRDLPTIKADKLTEFDGFLFGFPTRFGRAPAQVSAFFDQTGGLWATGALVGKFGGIFTGAAGQHGGHESTIFTSLPFFAHHGITFVPLGYRAAEISNEERIVGGSPWGASFVAGGKGSLPVLDDDKAAGHAQGKSFASLVSTFNAGKVALAAAPAAENAAEPVADVTGVVAAKEDAPVAAVAAKEPSALDTLGQPIVESAPVTDAAVVPETAPAAAVEEEKATGYVVPSDEKKEDEAVAALAAANPPAEELKGETVATESAPVTKAEETPAAAAAPEPTPAAAPAAPAAAPTKPAQQKKKSIWASCCGGGDGSDLKA